MRLTIGKKIGSLLLIMLVIAITNILVIYNFLNLQKHDSFIVNMAGRQRMLSIMISKQALLIYNGKIKDQREINKNIGLYDLSLKTLQYGGNMEGVIIPSAPAILGPLFEENKRLWVLFREKAKIVSAEVQGHNRFLEAISYLKARDDVFLEANNNVVNAYESLPDGQGFVHEINVAGRQRMLSQRISKYAVSLATEENEEIRKKLKKDVELFDKSFFALLEGGASIPWEKKLKVPPPYVRESLFHLEEVWKKIKVKLNIIHEEKDNNIILTDSVDYIIKHNDPLLEISGELTRSFDRIFGKKISNLKKLLLVMLGFDLLVFIMGCIIATNISRPLRKLTQSVRIAGEGDFSQKIDIPKPRDETRDLAKAFSNMLEDLKTTTVTRDYVDNIINSMTNFLFVINSDTLILTVNRAASDLLGYKEDELIGKRLKTILFEEKPDLKGRGLKDLIKKESFKNEEKMLLSKDGHKIPVLFSGSVMRKKNNEIVGTVCVAQDIMERIRAEKDLHHKSNLIQLLQEIAITANESRSADEAMMVCLVRVCAFTGWPIGHVYFPDSTRKLYPSKLWCLKDRQKFETFYKVTEVTSFSPGIGLPGRVMLSGKPAWIKDVSKDKNFPRSKVAEEIKVKAGFAFPVLEGKNVVAVLEFFSQEAREPDESLLEAISNLGTQLGRVTERKRAEEELKKHHDHLGSLVEERTKELVKTHNELKESFEETEKAKVYTDNIVSSMINSLVVLTQEGTIRMVNKSTCDMLGYQKKELIGLPGSAIFGEELFSEIIGIEDLNKSNLFRNLEMFYLTKNGRKIPVLSSGSVMTDNNGDIEGFVCVAQDITGYKNAEAALKDKQAQLIHAGRLTSLGEMATGVAHELNQPLAIIRSNIEGLNWDIKFNTFSVERVPEIVAGTLKQVDRAAKIIHHMRDFARAQEDSHEPIDLIGPITEGLSFFNEQFRVHDIEIEMGLKKGLPAVKVNPQRFEQVVVNLLSNARYAVEQKDKSHIEGYQKKISVFLYKNADHNEIIFQIMDNGIGMSTEVSERCMDPFFTTKEVGEGTGLGLSIIHGIVNEFGGRIEVESGPDVGTTFRVNLPIA